MSEYQEVPENYEADTEEFEGLYVLAWLLIIRALMALTRLPVSPSKTAMLTLQRNVIAKVSGIIGSLNKKAVETATKQVTEAYTQGVLYARLSLSQEDKTIKVKEVNSDNKNKVSTNTKVNLNNSHKRRLDKIITQTQEDLLKATHNTEENIKRLVRKVVSKDMNDIGKGGKIGKRSNMAKRVETQLRKQFLEQGIQDADVAIIDKANRKWKLKTYSSMVARTKSNMAYIDAIREEALQDGADLAIISTKPDTVDECKNYEGMIISLNGLTAGYLTYEEIKKSKKCFHPNCGHFVRPIKNLSFVPAEQLEIHKKKMKDYMSKQQ